MIIYSKYSVQLFLVGDIYIYMYMFFYFTLLKLYTLFILLNSKYFFNILFLLFIVDHYYLSCIERQIFQFGMFLFIVILF
jgi:hypothetical protein